MTTTVSAAQVLATLKILSTFNFKGAIAAFEGEDTATKITDGVILVDDAAKIVGVFFPPAAVVVNDIEVAVEIEQIAQPYVLFLASQPFTLPPGTQLTMGVLTTNEGLFQWLYRKIKGS